jgi:hypothetical protein
MYVPARETPAEISLLIRVVCTSAGNSSRDIITNKSVVCTQEAAAPAEMCASSTHEVRYVHYRRLQQNIITNKSGLYTCRELQLQQGSNAVILIGGTLQGDSSGVEAIFGFLMCG